LDTDEGQVPKFHIEIVTAEIRRFARKHEERLLRHDNVEAIHLLDNSELISRLRRTKPFELDQWTLTHKHRAMKYNQPPNTNDAWYPTHDAGADYPIKKGQSSVNT
jgi:hypothetical protein